MAFFKYLLILLVIAWLLPKVFKFLFRMFLLMIGRKMQKEMAKQPHEGNSFAGQPFAGQPQPTQQQPDTGNIHVYKNPQEPKEFDGGEYVDYEEVKD
ncbi:MAG: hypothetical protein ACJAWV_002845 [Flammeovirgaceae bacterium]|jgi:hypothetical protein